MRIVLFGIGKMLAREWPLQLMGAAEIVALVDNNIEKQGTIWNGFQILAPSALCDLKYDRVMVTSEKNFEEISNELQEEYHIEKRNILRMEPLVVPSECNLGDMKVNMDMDICYPMSELKNIVQHSDNRLAEFFFFEEHRIINKWWHYFEIYEMYFRKFVNRPIKMLEIGVFKGGSLQMWKNYFGEKAKIVGIDIDPECKEFEEDQIHICIGSQNDVGFLENVCKEYGPFDIVLDDGSHMMEHQITSFETLFPHVREGGIYLCEDTHTSYWKNYDGALRGENTFIEYAKRAIDELHSQYITDGDEKELLQNIRMQIYGVHFYDSMVVFEKRRTGVSVYSLIGK